MPRSYPVHTSCRRSLYLDRPSDLHPCNFEQIDSYRGCTVPGSLPRSSPHSLHQIVFTMNHQSLFICLILQHSALLHCLKSWWQWVPAQTQTGPPWPPLHHHNDLRHHRRWPTWVRYPFTILILVLNFPCYIRSVLPNLCGREVFHVACLFPSFLLQQPTSLPKTLMLKRTPNYSSR
jgi:hypothetical protein